MMQFFSLVFYYHHELDGMVISNLLSLQHNWYIECNPPTKPMTTGKFAMVIIAPLRTSLQMRLDCCCGCDGGGICGCSGGGWGGGICGCSGGGCGKSSSSITDPTRRSIWRKSAKHVRGIFSSSSNWLKWLMMRFVTSVFKPAIGMPNLLQIFCSSFKLKEKLILSESVCFCIVNDWLSTEQILMWTADSNVYCDDFEF